MEALCNQMEEWAPHSQLFSLFLPRVDFCYLLYCTKEPSLIRGESCYLRVEKQVLRMCLQLYYLRIGAVVESPPIFKVSPVMSPLIREPRHSV